MNEKFDELEDLKERKQYFLENYRLWTIEAVEAYKKTLIRDIGAYYYDRL